MAEPISQLPVSPTPAATDCSGVGLADQMVHVFGVRHLSPMGAFQLRRFLDEIQPDLVLIEGLSDANGLIKDITRKTSVPPIAILAYSDSVPVRTLVYPFATYSPEYQALLWAKENRKKAQFIDLPSDVFLALQKFGEHADHRGEKADLAEEDAPPEEDLDDVVSAPTPKASWLEQKSLYSQIAEQAGESDYDTYWERRFEHNLAEHSYRESAFQIGLGIRELESTQRPDWAETLVRESFMRRQIRSAIDDGIAPEKIVAVVGAYHASVLTHEMPMMSDQELARLPRLASKLTLMPYSYFKLSSQSGYGAGNEAPAYYELIWNALQNNSLQELASRYMTDLARGLRDHGTHRSTAAVIEGVRLSQSISALKNGLAPTLRDLQDAAISLIGLGHRSVVAQPMAQVEIGTAIGKLPKGVSQTSIQHDFDHQLERLKLTKYRTTVRTELGLDLREKRTAKTPAAAFLDLHRSSFLHRLKVLGISFAAFAPIQQQSASWAERWFLQWSPESEIQLVESVLLGETVELAVGFQFQKQIEQCETIAQAAALVKTSCQCAMLATMEQARQKLQALSVEGSDFVAIASAATDLSHVIRYGDVRNYDASPLVPLVDELYTQAALSIFPTANCDNQSAPAIMNAIDQLNKVGHEHHDTVDEPLWRDRLQKLARADDRNPLLSGYACAVLLESNVISNEELAQEVSRRLSPGIAADLGAGWFEGVSARNRYALLARQPLWEQLQQYIHSLDDEEFRRALVFLRRAFGGFTPQEKRSICENLSHAWGLDQETASEMVSQPLSEKEEQAIDDLNDFDFGEF